MLFRAIFRASHRIISHAVGQWKRSPISIVVIFPYESPRVMRSRYNAKMRMKISSLSERLKVLKHASIGSDCIDPGARHTL